MWKWEKKRRHRKIDKEGDAGGEEEGRERERERERKKERKRGDELAVSCAAVAAHEKRERHALVVGAGRRAAIGRRARDGRREQEEREDLTEETPGLFDRSVERAITGTWDARTDSLSLVRFTPSDVPGITLISLHSETTCWRQHELQSANNIGKKKSTIIFEIDSFSRFFFALRAK